MVAGRCCAPSRGSFPFIEKVFADSGYAGEKVATATVIAVEIVRKSPDQVGFAVQPRRWVVERFFAWINRNRATGKGFRGHHRLGPRLPLRRLRHAPPPQIGPSRMTFETDSKGLKSWHEDLDGAAFSAHPKVEPDGTLWNFGYAVAQGLIVLYHIGKDGRVRRAGTVPVDNLGMVHDFVVTARHLVFVLSPLVYDRSRFGPSSSFLDAHDWRPELGMRVLVVAKDDFSQRRWYQLPSGFTFHFGNVWEDAAGTIRFDYCVAPDATVMTETLRYVMRGELRPPTAPTRFAQVVLHTDGKATQHITEAAAEFPRVAPAVVGRRYRQVYMLSGGSGISGAGLSAVARHDIEAGTTDSFDYGNRFTPEEHVFVPRPGANGETDGWVIGTALDHQARITRLSVFEAGRISDGPIASAALPYVLPLGFHGSFVTA